MYISTFYREILGLKDDKLIGELVPVTEIQHYFRKGERLIMTDRKPVYVMFLLKGIVRGFFMDAKGTDYTDCFVKDCGAAAMPPAQNSKGLPCENMEAATDCDVLCFPMSRVPRLLKTYPEALLVYSRLLQESLQRHWDLKMMRYCRTAGERYAWFRKAYAELDGQVKLKHIASFLDMKPATLSRLRRDQNEKGQ